MIIDTHAHLYSAQFEGEIETADMIMRAKEAGISKVILPAVDSLSHQNLFDLAAKYPDYLFPTIGLHPTAVNEFMQTNGYYESEIDVIEDMLVKHRKDIVAIGEIGLDYYWSDEFIGQQKEALATLLQIAKRENLPVILHIRDSKEGVGEIWNDVLQLIEERGVERGVFHSFAGSVEIVQRVMKLKGDWLFGVNGVLTFKKSPMPEVYADVPLDRLVFETDAPYLAPVPYRGKRNESSFIPEIALLLASVKGVSLDEISRVTTENANRMFNISH